MPSGSACQHLLGGGDLLTQAGRDGLDVHDDTVIGIDRIVGFIAKVHRSADPDRREPAVAG